MSGVNVKMAMVPTEVSKLLLSVMNLFTDHGTQYNDQQLSHYADRIIGAMIIEVK